MSSVIAAVTVVSATSSADAAGKSAEAIEKGAERGAAADARARGEALELNMEMAAQQRKDFAPWREAGEAALSEISAGLESGAFDMNDFQFQADPGYAFRMKEGIGAVDASAAARGRLLSGAQQKALTQYGQGAASQEYANAYARESGERARKFNILSAISGSGKSAAAGQASASGQLASRGGNIMVGGGQAQNLAYQNIGQARAGGYQGKASAINQGLQNWVTYRGQRSGQKPLSEEQKELNAMNKLGDL